MLTCYWPERENTTLMKIRLFIILPCQRSLECLGAETTSSALFQKPFFMAMLSFRPGLKLDQFHLLHRWTMTRLLQITRLQRTTRLLQITQLQRTIQAIKLNLTQIRQTITKQVVILLSPLTTITTHKITIQSQTTIKQTTIRRIKRKVMKVTRPIKQIIWLRKKKKKKNKRRRRKLSLNLLV